MKEFLILAAPLALVACGADVTQASGDAMPAPSPIAASDTAEKAEPAPEKQVTQFAGSWSDAEATNGQRIVFTSESGEDVISLTCQDPDAFAGEGAAKALVLSRPYEGDEAPAQIGLLTSAGNGAIQARVLEEESAVTGMFDTRSQAARSLANGRGDLRIVVGLSEYVVPTDAKVASLVEACRPPIEDVVKELNAAEDAPDGEEAESGGAPETPGGS